jgi:protein TonB
VTVSTTSDIPAARELFIAVLAHLVLVLGVTFGFDTGAALPLQSLDVRLVPEASDQRSTEAAYLAEFDRIGRGTTVERVRALTPRGLEAQRTEAQQETRGLPKDAGLPARVPVLAVLSLVPATRAAGAPADTPLRPGERAVQRAQQAERPPQLETGGDDAVDRARLTGPASREGELVSPDTRAAAFAPYLDRWRRKVERFGTLNFPDVAALQRARPPILAILLGADGTVRNIALQRSSGNTALDQAAIQIVRNAGRFEPFPQSLARNVGELRFAYEWRFETEPGNASGAAP